MQCYQHINNMAYSICTECGRGVCKDCVKNNNNPLACSVECLKLLIEKKEMNERGKKLYGIGQYATLKRSNADWLSMLFLGLTFTVYGSYITYQSYIYDRTFDSFITFIGLLFLLISFLFWKRGKKFGLKI